MVEITVVDSDEIRYAADLLDDLALGLQHLRLRVEGVDWWPAGWWQLTGPVANRLALAALDGELLALTFGAVEARAAVLAEQLRSAKERYERVDAAVEQLFGGMTEAVVAAGALSLASGLLGVATIGAGAAALAVAQPPALLLGAGAIGALALLQRSGAAGSFEEALAEGEQYLGPVLANPLTQHALRALVGAGDEIANGLLGTIAAVPGGAAVSTLIAPGGFRSLNEVAQRVGDGIQAVRGPSEFTLRHERERPPVAAPGSIAAVVASIPKSERDEPQVRITEYRRDDGSTAYLVSVAGTSSLELGGEWAFDNEGNLFAYGGEARETVAAVADAMAAAGIAEGDEVVFAGYSLGALVVTSLANTGRWEVPSAVTIGSPVHGNAIRPDAAIVQIEHDNDPIVGLQGPHQRPRGDLAIVTGSPYPDGVPLGADPFVTHLHNSYLTTAEVYDALDGELHAGHRADVLAPLEGAAPVASSLHTIHRVVPEAPPPAPAPRPSEPVDPAALQPSPELRERFDELREEAPPENGPEPDVAE